MRWLVVVSLALALIAGACGEDSADDGSGDPEGLPTTAPTSPASSAPTSPASDLPVESDGNAPGIPPLPGPPQTTASGLKYIDEVVGTGPPVPTPTTCVTVHYTGWLTDGSEFDSSVGGDPVPLPLSGVISGWTEGVGTMNEGGQRRLIIPSALAYGEQGRPPTIPGGATLIFDVELISIDGEPVQDPATGRVACPQ
jgi:hypothetical protein